MPIQPRKVVLVVTRSMHEDLDQIHANQYHVLMSLAPASVVQFREEWNEGFRSYQEKNGDEPFLENMEIVARPDSLKDSDDEYYLLVKFDGYVPGPQSDRLSAYRRYIQEVWDLGGIAGEFNLVEY